jgi:hypothetical protein
MDIRQKVSRLTESPAYSGLFRKSPLRYPGDLFFNKLKRDN